MVIERLNEKENDEPDTHTNKIHIHDKLSSIRCTEHPSIIIENETNLHNNQSRQIVTDLYRKETERPRALLPSSCHPNHITKNNIYGMAFRLLRICSSESIFESRLFELKKEYLIPRGYKNNVIEQQFSKVRNFPGASFVEKRKQALLKRNVTKNDSDRVIAVMDYNPHLPNANMVLTKHHRSMIDKNDDIKQDLELPPMIAYRQPRSLRRILCKSKLEIFDKRQKRHDEKDWKPCGNNFLLGPLTRP